MPSSNGPNKPSKSFKPGKLSSKSSSSKGALKPTKDSKSRVSKKAGPRPPPKQVKTKATDKNVKKKKRVYTDTELGLAPLNMITPVGVQKPTGKKKGKVFVDDAVGTFAISTSASSTFHD